MNSVPEPKLRYRHASRRFLTGATLLASLAAAAGSVRATAAADQDDGKQATSAPARRIIPQTIPLQVQPGTQQSPTSSAAGQKAGCGDKGSKQVPTPSPDGPQPVWTCEETVTADPIWRGTKAEFVFEVANRGDADLQIKLRPS